MALGKIHHATVCRLLCTQVPKPKHAIPAQDSARFAWWKRPAVDPTPKSETPVRPTFTSNVIESKKKPEKESKPSFLQQAKDHGVSLTTFKGELDPRNLMNKLKVWVKTNTSSWLPNVSTSFIPSLTVDDWAQKASKSVVKAEIRGSGLGSVLHLTVPHGASVSTLFLFILLTS